MPGSIAEQLYYLLPVPLQNVGFSLFGLGAWRSRFSKHFYDRLAELQESQSWPEDRIAAFQDEQVRGLIRHAYQTVPFYRRWYDQHGVDLAKINGRDDLKRLPVLTKDLVRENQDDMVSRAYPRRCLRVHLTSGTTGTPLRIMKTKQAISFQWALWWAPPGTIRADTWPKVLDVWRPGPHSTPIKDAPRSGARIISAGGRT